MTRKDWDVVKDFEELEAARNEANDIKEQGEKVPHDKVSKLGGLTTREAYGQRHFRNMARKRWKKAR